MNGKQNSISEEDISRKLFSFYRIEYATEENLSRLIDYKLKNILGLEDLQ